MSETPDAIADDTATLRDCISVNDDSALAALDRIVFYVRMLELSVTVATNVLEKIGLDTVIPDRIRPVLPITYTAGDAYPHPGETA